MVHSKKVKWEFFWFFQTLLNSHNNLVHVTVTEALRPIKNRRADRVSNRHKRWASDTVSPFVERTYLAWAKNDKLLFLSESVMLCSDSHKNLILDIPFFASFSFVSCHLTRWLWLDIVCYIIMLHMRYLDDWWRLNHRSWSQLNTQRAHSYITIKQLFSWKILPKATVLHEHIT